MKHPLPASVLLLSLAFPSLAMAQSPEPFKRMTFHVVEVHVAEDRQLEAEWCMPGTCSITKIEVSGFTKENRRTISYGLECDEVVRTPHTKVASTLCVHVQAGEDYPARIYPTAVMFGEEQHVEGAEISLYNIVSQREVGGPQK
jgi:hypothetical protein